MPPDALRAEVARTRNLTDRPFGINLVIAEDAKADPDDDRRFIVSQIRASAEAGAAAVVFFWGDPGPYVDESHERGMRVLIQVGSVEEAESAAAAGMDAVIAQGIEAGGHVRGTTSIWELLPEVVDAVAPLPVLASGGIGGGGGLTRALGVGAQAVSLGTASSRASRRPPTTTSSSASWRPVPRTPCTRSRRTTSGGPTRPTGHFATGRSSSGRWQAGLPPARGREREPRAAGGG